MAIGGALLLFFLLHSLTPYLSHWSSVNCPPLDLLIVGLWEYISIFPPAGCASKFLNIKYNISMQEKGYLLVTLMLAGWGREVGVDPLATGYCCCRCCLMVIDDLLH